ncbi:hypothetical protein KFK09_019701 [Dendrobium nobile]|uniref:SAP domain-containing protein n=1 Tax=Dendrobium nobile TaxID=94219 RepID=A0A8T3AQ79_DENNO|nr:hypothetical protein KFK09_019701 [Dendrobium nobile]
MNIYSSLLLVVFYKVEEEEEVVRSAILIASVVECWLRSLMLEKNWGCVGDSTFVNSTFASDEEKKYFQALNVITDLIASQALQSLHDGNITLVEKDRLFTACIILPSLCNGHILGLSKLPPVGENFELLEELWKFKHCQPLSSDYYVNVHFSYGGQAYKQWLPSAFVLRGSGLSPAPQTVRSSMAVNALNSFISTIGSSDFFGQGPLKVKDVSSLETPMMQPGWKAVGTASNDNKINTSATDQCLISQNLHLTLDFRTRKPAHWFISANSMLDHEKNLSAALTSDGMTETTTTCVFQLSIPKPLNEVVQATAKLPPVSQSETYQRAEKNEALGKRSFDKENKIIHSKEGKSDASMKMKTKQPSDSSDVNSKVFDFHARGKLQSLTVSDLKCFLASKKMKVGGKKEELIGRVTAMLD